MSRVLIYVSGPFTALSKDLEQANINRAVEAGYRVRTMGATPLVPHVAVLPPRQDDLEAIWGEAMQDCLAMLKGCDAILMLPDWERSRGAKVELLQAEQWGLEIFYSEDTLAERLRRVA